MNDLSVHSKRRKKKTKVSSSKKPEEKVALLVLGMHRSGTSATAGVLSRLGASLPKNQMSPSKDNPKGYSESKAIMAFNERLLESAGSCWFDINSLNENWDSAPFKQHFVNEATALLEGEFGSSPFVVVKDPRICRLANFWLEVIKGANYSPRIVIPIRNPVEVAESLKKRNELSINYSLLLWLRHLLDAELSSRGFSRSFIRYESLIVDWRAQFRRVGVQLNVGWPKLTASIENDIDQYVSKDLYRNRSVDTQLLTSTAIREIVQDAYKGAQQLVLQPDDASAIVLLDDVRDEFNKLCCTVGGLLLESATANAASRVAGLERNKIGEQNTKLSIEIERLKQSLDRSQQSSKKFELKLDKLRHEYSSSIGKVSALEALVGVAESKCERLESELSSSRYECADLQQEIKRLQEAKARNLALESELMEVRIENESTRSDLQQARGSIVILDQHIVTLEDNLRKMRESLDASENHKAGYLDRLSNLHAELQDDRNKLALLRSENAQLESDREALRRAVSMKEEQFVQQTAELTEYKDRLRGQIDRAEQALAHVDELSRGLAEVQEEKKAMVSVMEEESAHDRNTIFNLESQIVQLERKNLLLKDGLKTRFEELAKLTSLALKWERLLIKSDKRIDRLQRENRGIEKRLKEEVASRQDREREIRSLKAQEQRLYRRIEAFERSFSWRITSPLRSLKRVVRKLSFEGRRRK